MSMETTSTDQTKTDKWTNGQSDKWTNRQTDKRTNGKMEKQTNCYKLVQSFWVYWFINNGYIFHMCFCPLICILL